LGDFRPYVCGHAAQLPLDVQEEHTVKIKACLPHPDIYNPPMRTEYSIDPAVALPQVEKMLLSLAWKITQAYPVPFEEARAEAYFHFMSACRMYKPQKGKFSTWCYFVVWMQLKTFITNRAKDPHVFVEIDDDLCGAAPEDGVGSLLRDLPADARELFTMLCDAPREVLEGFRLLLHGDDFDQELDNTCVEKAVRFLKSKGKSVVDLVDLNQAVVAGGALETASDRLEQEWDNDQTLRVPKRGSAADLPLPRTCSAR
jgi:hypothetical protein